MTNTMTKTREGGFTLLELLLVIGVAALLLIGGIATYRLVSEGNKTTDSTRLLLTIRQQTQTMAQQSSGSYVGIDFDTTAPDATEALVVAGILKEGQRNPFNGNIFIQGAANQLTVRFEGLPKAACVRLMQSMTNPSDLISVAGNGGATLSGTDIPVTATNAAAGCTGTSNTITWVFP